MSLARTNGATIDVESEGQGKGTRVTVQFAVSRKKIKGEGVRDGKDSGS